MPKTFRQLLQRQIAEAHKNIDLAMKHIIVVHQEFEPVHPELAESLEVAVTGLDTIQSILKSFMSAAWGRENPDWDAIADNPDPQGGEDAD